MTDTTNTPAEAKPASLVNIAFDTGRLEGVKAERHRVRLLIQTQKHLWQTLGYTDAVTACIDLLALVEREPKSEDQ